MSSSKTHTICPNCFKTVPAQRSHCTVCGMALPEPFPLRRDPIRDSHAETDYGGILDLADEIESAFECPQWQAQGNGSRHVVNGESTMVIDGATPLPENRSYEEATTDLIRLACKSCGRKLRVKSGRAGHKIKCPKCEHVIPVPRLPERPSTAESGIRREPGQTDLEVNFSELAMQMEPQGKSSDSGKTPGKSSPAIKQTELKKTLSSRKYRQLTKILEQQGAMNAEQIRQRADCLKELGHSGDCRAYEWLAADLEHPELPIRQAAAVGLGDLGDARSAPALVGLLDDRSMVMRKAAVLGLGKIKDPRAIEPLLFFGLNDPQMKFLASEAVLGLGPEAVQPLIELLEHKELGIVLEAVVLLGRLKDAKARRALTAVIDARRPLIQCHAIEALGQIADPKSIGPLTRLLEDPDGSLRTAAAAALSKMASDKNIVAPLVKSLGDPNADVVVQAAKGLGESGDPRASEPLARLLKSPSSNIRVAAAQALGALGDQRAVPHLLSLLDEESEETQIKILSALRTMKPPHISGSLLKHLHHQSAAVRRRVVDVLGPIGDAEVAEKLESLLRTDPADEVRMAAARALGEIADPASVDCLKDALHNDEFNVRCQVIGALGRIGDEECYSTLIGLLDDQVAEVRFHAASALGDLGNKNAVPVLKEMLKDKNPMVVRGVSKSLEKLGVENVEQLAKSAQRSRKMTALSEMVLTVKSWFPDSLHTQKMFLGGSLAALVVVSGLGWLLYSLFKAPPTRVIARGNVLTVSFLPGDEQIAVGRTLGLVELWKAGSTQPAKSFTPTGGERALSTPNPDVLAIVGATAVQLWKLGSDEEFPPQSGHSKPIERYAQTPDRNLLATLSSDGVAIVWELANGQPRGAVQLPAKETLGFCVSADGTLFAGGNEKGIATVWDAATGDMVKQFAGSTAVVSTALSPDGKLLVVSYARSLVLWSVESGEKLATFADANSLANLQFDPSGKWMAGVEGSTIWIWDAGQLADSKAKARQIEVKARSIEALAFSADGSKIVLGGPENSAVWIHDVNTGDEISRLDAR